jgi:ABC-2 type transport system permease protein
MLASLAGRAFADRLHSTLAWTIGLAAMVALQLAVYPSIREQAEEFRDLIDAYPPAFKAFFDVQGDFTSGPGFLAAEVFGFLAPLCLIAVAIGHLAGATAAEEERGTLDLLLANPVPRWLVVAGKAVAATASLGLVAVALGATLVAGDLVLDLDVGAGRIATAVGLAALLALAFGAVALLVGSGTGRRGAGIGAGVGLAVGSFLLESLGSLSPAMDRWRVLSLFHHASPADALSSTPGAGGIALAAAVVLVAGAAAVLVFDRRDLRA